MWDKRRRVSLLALDPLSSALLQESSPGQETFQPLVSFLLFVTPQKSWLPARQGKGLFLRATLKVLSIKPTPRDTRSWGLCVDVGV